MAGASQASKGPLLPIKALLCLCSAGEFTAPAKQMQLLFVMPCVHVRVQKVTTKTPTYLDYYVLLCFLHIQEETAWPRITLPMLNMTFKVKINMRLFLEGMMTARPMCAYF